MIIEVKNKDVYIPEFNGNQELPKDQQIKIHHRFLLPEERKKYIYDEPIKISTTGADAEMVIVQDLMGIVKAIVTKIENLEISCDGKKVKIDTAEKMYNTSGVPQKLVAKIEAFMRDVSPEVDVDFLAKP